MNARYTIISCLHITVTHACIVSIFLTYGSPFILHVLLLHVYSCIPVAWLFPITAILVTGYMSCWYVMCGTKCHVEPSHGATSRIPHLLFSVSRYLVICYQQSSGPLIMLHVPCTILVLAMQCTLNIMNIIWGWGRLDSWLGLIGWMSGSIASPTAGDVVGWLPFVLYCFLLLP